MTYKVCINYYCINIWKYSITCIPSTYHLRRSVWKVDNVFIYCHSSQKFKATCDAGAMQLLLDHFKRYVGSL